MFRRTPKMACNRISNPARSLPRPAAAESSCSHTDTSDRIERSLARFNSRISRSARNHEGACVAEALLRREKVILLLDLHLTCVSSIRALRVRSFRRAISRLAPAGNVVALVLPGGDFHILGRSTHAGEAWCLDVLAQSCCWSA
jgi:hypothetical protein